MTRMKLIEILTQIYPRGEAETRVVQTSPSLAEVNCEFHKRNLRFKNDKTHKQEKCAKALFLEKNVEYKEQNDGSLLVTLDAPATPAVQK